MSFEINVICPFNVALEVCRLQIVLFNTEVPYTVN